MPVYFRQPLSLERLSLDRVCGDLAGTCQHLQMIASRLNVAKALTLAKEVVRPHYENALPAYMRCRVIKNISKILCNSSPKSSDHTHNKSTLLFLLAVLLNRDVKQLNVQICCYYNCSHQASLLKLLATEGAELKSLQLNRFTLLQLDCKLLYSALQNMKNLSCLTLNNIASDSALRVIGKACPKLVVLDVSGSRHVTDMGLRDLLMHTVELKDRVHFALIKMRDKETLLLRKIRHIWDKMNSKKAKNCILLEYHENKNSLCDTLRVLNVDNTDITSYGMLFALTQVPQLESLYCRYIEEVIQFMNQEFIVLPKVPFSLTEIISLRMTSAELEYLARICPKVQKLYIYKPYHPPELLRMFASIDSLSIKCVPSEEWMNGFYDYLGTSGHNLRQLDLQMDNLGNFVQIDLRRICSSCPNLHTFIANVSNVVWTEGSDPPPLRHFEKVKIGCKVNTLTIKKIVLLAPELAVLHLYDCFDLTNEQLIEILTSVTQSNNGSTTIKRNCSQNLTCFCIHKANNISLDEILEKVFYNKQVIISDKKVSNFYYENTFNLKYIKINVGNEWHWDCNNCF